MVKDEEEKNEQILLRVPKIHGTFIGRIEMKKEILQSSQRIRKGVQEE